MHFISHRGNLNGPNKNLENKPNYIKEALDKGFDVEIDVWLSKEKFYLGHDEPLYETDVNFIITDFQNEIIVNFKGSVPNLFEEGKGVVAEGFIEDRNYFKNPPPISAF